MESTKCYCKIEHCSIQVKATTHVYFYIFITIDFMSQWLQQETE